MKRSVLAPAVAGSLLLFNVQVFAAAGPSDFDADVQCGAFQRHGVGSWTATAPTTLDFGVFALSVAPGDTFAPNQTVNGAAVSAIIDRHCGN